MELGPSTAFGKYGISLLVVFGGMIFLDSLGVPHMKLLAVVVGLGAIIALVNRNTQQ